MRLRWRLLLIGIRELDWHREVDIDLQLLDFLVDKAEGGGDDGIGSLDTLKCEYTELELVQSSWGCILEGLNLQQEDGCCSVDAVGKGKDDMVIAERAAIQIEER